MQSYQFRATLVGLIAIGFSSTLAVLSATAKGIPPFQLLSMTASVPFLGGILVLGARGREALSVLRQPVFPWALAVLAIFLYHATYFYATATIPAARASLIAYLWPLLIVVFAALTPGGGGVQMKHFLGALLGLLGITAMFAGKASVEQPIGHLSGYLAAVFCALIWSGYSVINRRFSSIPSQMLIGVCGGVALMSGASHLAFEDFIAPTGMQWSVVAMLGVGPIGLTFISWDYATKHGNISLLGVISFSTPILSTGLLVLAGQALPSIWLGVAACLVVAGALVASSPQKRSVAHDMP